MFNAPFLNKAAGEKVYDIPRIGPAILVRTIYPRRGTKTEYHFMPVKKQEKGSYMIFRISDALDRHVKAIRDAKPAEVADAKARYEATINHNQEIKNEIAEKNLAKIDLAKVEPGDVVEFRYTDGVKKEVVEAINYREGRVALRRRGYAADYYVKNRYVNAQFIESIVEKGPGHYDPNNPMYQKYGFYPEDPSFDKYGPERRKKLEEQKQMRNYVKTLMERERGW